MTRRWGTISPVEPSAAATHFPATLTNGIVVGGDVLTLTGLVSGSTTARLTVDGNGVYGYADIASPD